MNSPQVVKQLQFELITPACLVARRISNCALSNYFSAVNLFFINRLDPKDAFACQAQISGLISVDSGPEFELQMKGLPFYPAQPRTPNRTLENELAEIPVPKLAGGAVAFVITVKSDADSEPNFDPPFAKRVQAFNNDSFQENFQTALGNQIPQNEIEENYERTPNPETWLQRIKRWFKREPPPFHFIERNDPDSPLFPFNVNDVDYNDIKILLRKSPDQPEPLLFQAEWDLAHENYDIAKSSCNIVIDRFPNDARAFYSRAVVNSCSGATDLALADVETAIRLAPNYYTARLRRTRILAIIGAMEEARDEANRCIDLKPFQIEPHEILSHLLYESGDFAGALKAANQILRLDPHNPETIGWRATLLRESGKQPDCKTIIKSLDHAVSLNPESSGVLLERAFWKWNLGDWSGVLKDCDHLEKHDHQNEAMVLSLRATAHLEQGKLQDAKQESEKALELDSSILQAYFIRARCNLILGELEAVPGDLEKLLEHDPDDLNANCMMGDVHAQQNNPEESLRYFEKLIQLSPENPFIQYKISHVYFLQDRNDEAFSAIDAAIEMDPLDPHYRHAKSWFLSSLNSFNESLDEINISCREDKWNPAHFFQRAQVCLGLNNKTSAIEDLDRAIELEPEFTEAISLRAHLHTDNSSLELAEKDYNALVEMFPDTFIAYSLRAGLYQRMGRHQSAQEDMKSAIELNPGAAEEVMTSLEMSQADEFMIAENYDEAIHALTEVMSKEDEFSLIAQLKRASCFWYDEQFVEAITDYDSVLEKLSEPDGDLELNRFTILGARGQVYAELGEYELAIEDLNQVINADTRVAHPILKAYSLSGRGLALTGLKKFSEAEKDFQESVIAAPDNAWVYYNQGLFYLNQDSLEKARTCFEMALNMDNPKLTPRKRKKARQFLK